MCFGRHSGHKTEEGKKSNEGHRDFKLWMNDYVTVCFTIYFEEENEKRFK